MVWVTDARPLPRYRLWLRFSDGVDGQVDLSDLIATDHRPIVAALRDETLFAALHVEHDTVVWQNGFDLAPEYLRDRLRTAEQAH